MPDTPAFRVRERVLTGLGWVTLGSVFSQAGTFFVSVAAARLLGREGFGCLATVQVILATLAASGTFGFGAAAIKFVAELRNASRERLGRLLGLCALCTALVGLVSALLLVGFAPWLAGAFLGSVKLAGALQAGAFYVFCACFSGFQTGVLTGFEAFRPLTRVGAIQSVLLFVLTLILSWGFGVPGAVWAMGLGAAASCFLFQRSIREACVRHEVRVRFRGAFAESRVLGEFSTPSALSGYFSTLAVAGANALLARRPGGFAQLALFQSANTLRAGVLAFPSLIMQVFSPILCQLRAGSDAGAFRSAIGKCLALTCGITGVGALALWATAPWALKLFGKDFASGQDVLAILLLVALWEVLAVGLSQVLYSHGAIWRQFLVAVLWGGTLLGGTWFSVGAYGARGLAGAYLAAWLIASVGYGLVTRKLQQGGMIALFQHRYSGI